ncbi:MAG: TetR family transcriptional regulator C-terminal domain-containing protein [Verrucomicrobiota bacterium]
MARVTNREKLLKIGLRLMHERGLAASVRDIVEAAGVPQGSFTNHFASKEAFCLEILNLYHDNARQVIDRTLRNEAVPPLARLRRYIDAHADFLKAVGKENGCLYGNFTAESSEHSEAIRRRLVEIFAEIRSAITYCLKAAVKAGELPRTFKCTEVADFILSSMQGAMLLGRGQRSTAPLAYFRNVLFNQVLH